MTTKKSSKYAAFIQRKLRGEEFDRELEKQKREVFIYARVSTHEQAHKFSIASQLKDLKAFAEEKGYKVKKENVITEDETSTEGGTRSKFGKLMTELQSGRSYTLICTETDRLHRNFTDAEALDTLVKEGKLVIWFIWEDKKRAYDWRAKSHDKIIRYFKTLMAKAYVEAQTEKSIAGTIEKLEAGGYPGYPPMGYLVVNGKIVKDEERFELIEQCFNLARTGKYVYSSLANEMRSRGLTVRVQKRELREKKEPRLVTKPDIERIIKNEFYTGHFSWYGQQWSNRGVSEKNSPSYPIMLTSEDWEEANKAMEKEGKIGRGKKSHSHSWFYKDILTCDFCGCHLVGYKAKGKYVYYQCSSGKKSVNPSWYEENFPEFCTQWRNRKIRRKAKHCPCPQPIWKEEEIDEAVREAIEELYFNEDTFTWMRERIGEDVRERRDTINSELRGLQTRKGKLQIQLEDLILSKGTYQDEVELKIYEKKKRELTTEIDALTEKIEEIETNKLERMEEAIDSLELAYSFKTKYLDSDKENQVMMLRLMFRTILAGSETHMKHTRAGESVIVIPSKKDGNPNYNKVLGFVWREPFRTLFDIQALEDMKDIRDSMIKKAKNAKWHAWGDSNARPTDPESGSR